MAIEFLCLGNDGPAGRKKGAIINYKTAPDDEDIAWGKAERPPAFFIVRIESEDEKTIPPEWFEFGGHISKAIVDVDKLTKAEKDDVEDDEMYAAGKSEDGKAKKPKKAKRKFTKKRLGELKKDNTTAWDAAHVEPVEA